MGLLRWQQQRQRLTQPVGDSQWRHELATRAGVLRLQNQQHQRRYRLTTEQARKWLESRLEGSVPAVSTNVLAPKVARAPIVLVRLADINNERRSASFRPHRSGSEQARTPPNQLSDQPLVEQLVGVSVASNQSSTVSSATIGSSGQEDSRALECKLLRHTFRARRSDGNGNECVGLLTASICYGGCETGELADWLFPHKKSIHKVCTHGERVRRQIQLTDCNTPFARLHLREYSFVDALNCSCKRCSSADTTCVGSLSRPDPQSSVEVTSAPGPD